MVIGREMILALIGCSYGLLAAAGIFTVLIAVGLLPRFAGETHTANRVLLYEEMVIFGTIVGGFCSIFTEYSQIGAMLRLAFPARRALWDACGEGILAVIGVFVGMFVGSLALAIAEMLDSIPIFTRRISFHHGIGLAVLAIAAGKLCGALLYFRMQ